MKKNIRSLLFLSIIIVTALFVVFYRYNNLPKHLNHDETELARVALFLDNKPFTPFTNIADGHPTVYFYLILGAFKAYGINSFGLRLPSAISGFIAALFFYLIMRVVFKKDTTQLIPLMLGLTFITLRWFINFARFSFEMPFLLALELISLYFYLSFRDNKKRLALLIISSLFAGLAFNSYQPGRIFFLVPLIGLILDKTNLKTVCIYLVALMVVIAPVSYHLAIRNTDDVRFHQQFFLKNSDLTIEKKAGFLIDNVVNTSLMFGFKGDMNGRHNYPGKPALNPILNILIIAGLAIAVIKRKDFYIQIFGIYFILAMLPTILTYPWENPNMLRTYTAIPALIFFIGQFIWYMNKQIRKKYPNYMLIFYLIIALILLSSSIYELRGYFVYQKLVFVQAFDKPDMLRLIPKQLEKENIQ